MKILMPVRYSAWLSGELGKQLFEQLQEAMSAMGATVTRLPRGLLVEADECAGPLLEATARAAEDLEDAVAERYPVFWHEMGPVWTGTLQAVFPARSRVAVTGATQPSGGTSETSPRKAIA